MRSFTVETRGQGVIVLGGPIQLAKALVEELLLLGVKALIPQSTQDIETLRLTHDLDYIVTIAPYDNLGLGTYLSPLIESGESRLVTTHSLTSSVPPTRLTPIFKNIIYADYVGVGEIYSPLIESWFSSIASHNTITLSGDGLGEVSILSLSDLSHLIALSVLSPVSQLGTQIILGNPVPISHLNLAYFTRSNLPFKTDLTFNNNSDEYFSAPDIALYDSSLLKLASNITSDYKSNLKTYLMTKIKPHTQTTLPVPPRVTPPIPATKLVPKLKPLKAYNPVFVPLSSQRSRRPINFSGIFSRPQKTGPLRLRSIVGRGVVIAIALYLGTLAFTTTISILSLRQTLASLTKNEIPRVTKLSRFSLTYLRANLVVLGVVPGVTNSSLYADTNLLLDAYDQSMAIFLSSNMLSDSISSLSHYVFGGGSEDVVKVLSSSRLQVEELYQKLSLLDGSLPETAPNLINAKYEESYKTTKAKLTKIKRSVVTAKAVLAATPEVIGIGGRKKYGVLFQNNMELRATGGFIGSFAIMSFENGKLYDMPIYDVYEADGQLKGHVEPPTAIKEILGEANWYLRDSNFDPDFPTTARRAEWFIKKSLNQDLDGTIAINVNTLIGLLEATGPLTVPDYNETITAGNLYERSQYHAEVNFFPGSTQKKEFLSSVASILFAKLPSFEAGDSLKLIAALSDSIEEKNTLISLVNPVSDQVFDRLGWNGHISDYPCPSTGTCHKDYTMVVDSNFGVNKANYFIKRNIEQIITFDKNLTVGHTLRINYQNTSTSTAWPAGIYKNYQRLYLPVGATIGQIKIGEKVLGPSDYSVTSEHNKTVVAYLASVPINSKLLIEVEYSTPQLPQENELLYTWYWQKQPGTSSLDNVQVYLNYPLYLSPVVISPVAQVATQQLKFDMVNDTDHRLTVKFTK